jgi:hypothetical protein
MRLTLLVVVLPLVLAGCSTWNLMNPFGAPSTMLAKADRLTADGDYRSAVATYDAYLAQYPDDSQAIRARRDAVASIMTTRDEIARLTQELARVRASSRSARRSGRVRREAEKLGRPRALKQIDLQLEKRK